MRLEAALRALPIPDSSPYTLNLGCGAFPEQANLGGDGVHLGVDWERQTQLQAPFYFVQANAAHLPFKIKFRLILLRHPNVAQHPQTWQSAVRQIPQWLAPRGVFLLSVYEWGDYASLRAHLALTPLHIHSPVPLDGSDRFLWFHRSKHAGRV